MKKSLCIILVLCFILSFSSCLVDNLDTDINSNTFLDSDTDSFDDNTATGSNVDINSSDTSDSSEVQSTDFDTAPPVDLGGKDDTFGSDLEDSGINDGYFEDESEVTITHISGTENAYKIENGVVNFSSINEDSVYSISGKFNGSIIIDIGDEYKFDLELQGFSLICENDTPVTILSGDKVSLTAKKDFKNYVYDNREAVTEEDTTQYSGAIYSLCDLEICGKGELTVVSKNNNGIHSKDDLKVKNLTLLVSCKDNALKGNDGVTIESGKTTLIATQGDGIKTTNSDISTKGNQRGIVHILSGEHTVYSACDGIDGAYDVIIEGEETKVTIYTDKYSNYSDEVTNTSESVYYIRNSSKNYTYSVKYYNSDSDFVWVNANYHSEVSGSRTKYYYYSFEKLSNYDKIQVFVYSSGMTQGQDEEYYLASDLIEPNESYDTFALSTRMGNWNYSWTNYSTTVQDGFGGGFGGGPGGMGPGMDGNTDKGDYSTKGIKSSNEINIYGGTITIKSYDDAIHANNDVTLENGVSPSGNVTVYGGVVTVYSNDDGLHADGVLSIQGGSVFVTNSYEGLEGNQVKISGGFVSVISKDDGINSTMTSGNAINISGGTVYVYAGGDGIDSNSRTSYEGIIFNGGDVVVISTSGGNSAIDTENGYTYNGGRVIAIMPSGGMSSESKHGYNFTSVGTTKNTSLSNGIYLTVKSKGENSAIIKMPCSISSAMIVYLGSTSIDVSTSGNANVDLDSNSVYWY